MLKKEKCQEKSQDWQQKTPKIVNKKIPRLSFFGNDVGRRVAIKRLKKFEMV